MKKKGTLILACLLVLLTACAGCNSSQQGNQSPSEPSPTDKQDFARKAALYFSDDQAMYLVAEQRTIHPESDQVADVAKAELEELIQGPTNQDLLNTIPVETRVLDVEVNDGLATVNFSEELSSKHSGGSTGETMTIFSIVNTLTELDGIDRVQILIEGEKRETLAGHWYIAEPVERKQEAIRP